MIEKTKNILSIDMDYILAPCINIYNDLVNASNPPEKIWETVNRVRDADKHISYDNENLRYVFNIFANALSKLKNKKNVTFALNHDAILFELASDKYIDDKFRLFNIDHHHDIYYSDVAKKEVEKFHVATVANWVWYLDQNNKLAKYDWICNGNSTFPEGKVVSIAQMDAHTKDRLPEIFEIDSWDYIFVCNSPHWFPKDYHVFFHMLIDMYKNITGEDVKILEGVFSPNSIARPYPCNITPN